MKKVRIVNLRMERHGMSTKKGGGISCKGDVMPFRVYELAYSKHADFVQQLEKG